MWLLQMMVAPRMRLMMMWRLAMELETKLMRPVAVVEHLAEACLIQDTCSFWVHAGERTHPLSGADGWPDKSCRCRSTCWRLAIASKSYVETFKVVTAFGLATGE